MTGITTPRLLLRPFAEADREAMIGFYGDPVVMAVRKYGVRDRAAASAAFDEILAHWAAHGFGLCAVVERAGGAFCGECGLRWNLGEERDIELSYGLFPAFRGRGYATEAAAASLAWGSGDLGLDVIVARSRGDNAVSHRVLEKLGMRLVWRKDGRHAGDLGVVKYEIDAGRWRAAMPAPA